MKSRINFSEVLDIKNIKVLGYTTDFTQCECCGRDNLKGTVAILEQSSGVILHFGTGCAASADKYDTLDAVKAIKKEISKAVTTYNDFVKHSNTVAWRLLKDQFGIKDGKVNWSDKCYQTVSKQVLDHVLHGGRKVILFEGQIIPKQFRQDLDEAGLCLRIPFPEQF